MNTVVQSGTLSAWQRFDGLWLQRSAVLKYYCRNTSDGMCKSGGNASNNVGFRTLLSSTVARPWSQGLTQYPPPPVPPVWDIGRAWVSAPP